MKINNQKRAQKQFYLLTALLLTSFLIIIINHLFYKSLTIYILAVALIVNSIKSMFEIKLIEIEITNYFFSYNNRNFMKIGNSEHKRIEFPLAMINHFDTPKVPKQKLEITILNNKSKFVRLKLPLIYFRNDETLLIKQQLEKCLIR